MRLRPLLLTFVLICVGQVAMAQRSTVVLGLRSVEGDDELALALSQELRSTAGAVSEWSVGEQSVSLSQMALVHGCEETDESCLSSIAEGLSVDQVIYGTISHGSLDADFRYEVELALFDKGEMAIAKRTSMAFEQSQVSAASLSKLAGRLINGVAPTAATGTLEVHSNVEGAQVIVDGHNVGTISGGILTAENLSPNVSHEVRIEAIGYDTVSELVDLAPGKTRVLQLPLAADAVATVEPAQQWNLDLNGESARGESQDRGVPNWLPYGLIGLGVANVGGLVASWLVIKGVEDDPGFVEYSDLVKRFDLNAQDVCVEAGKQQTYDGRIEASRVSDVNSLCQKADAFEVLQYVFGGVAAASFIGAIVLFAVDDDDDDDSSVQSLALEPVFGRRMNGMRATLRF